VALRRSAQRIPEGALHLRERTNESAGGFVRARLSAVSTTGGPEGECQGYGLSDDLVAPSVDSTMVDQVGRLILAGVGGVGEARDERASGRGRLVRRAGPVVAPEPSRASEIQTSGRRGPAVESMIDSPLPTTASRRLDLACAARLWVPYATARRTNRPDRSLARLALSPTPPTPAQDQRADLVEAIVRWHDGADKASLRRSPWPSHLGPQWMTRQAARNEPPPTRSFAP